MYSGNNYIRTFLSCKFTSTYNKNVYVKFTSVCKTMNNNEYVYKTFSIRNGLKVRKGEREMDGRQGTGISSINFSLLLHTYILGFGYTFYLHTRAATC